MDGCCREPSKIDSEKKVEMKTYLLTGAAGFVGSHVAKQLLKKKCYVVGIDNINSAYDRRLKHHRINELKAKRNFKFYKVNLTHRKKNSCPFSAVSF